MYIDKKWMYIGKKSIFDQEPGVDRECMPAQLSGNRPFCTIIAWVRDGASGDGRSVTCIWNALRTVRNGDKKKQLSARLNSEIICRWLTDRHWMPVSNPGNNCANGLLCVTPWSCMNPRSRRVFQVWMYSSSSLRAGLAWGRATPKAQARSD